MLVPVSAGLLLVAYQCSLFYRQQTAIRHIKELGGRVVTTHGEPDWLRRLIGGRSLRVFEEATVVNLSRSEVMDDDLIHLQRLNGLQRLNVNEASITDDGLKHLARLTELKALDLSGTQITGNGLVHLHGLTALEYLYRRKTKFVDADLRHLEGLKKLRHIDVSGTAVGEEGGGEIKRICGAVVTGSHPHPASRAAPLKRSLPRGGGERA